MRQIRAKIPDQIKRRAGSIQTARYYYFGVTPGQSLNSVYAAYRPDAGLRDVRVSALAAYRLTPDWQVIASLTRTELQGDARRSPLVQQDGATTGVLVVGYRF